MKDPTEFRQRFAAWKAKKKVYDAGRKLPVQEIENVDYENLPKYNRGKTPRTISKNSDEYKRNVQKQQYLKSLGYNVQINGGWGPSLQRMYDEATARPKEYPRTAFGLIEGLWDKVTGNDKRHIQPFPTIQNTEEFGVKEDRSNYEGVDSYQLNKDYWEPVGGAPSRWKSSISNQTNPILGLENSFGQAATFSGGASLLSKAPAVPSLLRAGYNTAKSGAINAAKVLKILPKVVNKTATEKETRFFKEGLFTAAEKTAPFIKSMLGGEFVNATSKAFNNGDSFGKVFSQYSGLPEWLAEFANPGYLLGGWRTHAVDHLRSFRKNNFLRNIYAKQEDDLTENILHALRREIGKKRNQIINLYDNRKELINTTTNKI